MAWTAGAILTAANLNTYLPQATTTWASPLSSGVTVGNGTTTAVYTQVGKIVVCDLIFTLGSTSAITGSLVLSLPVTAHSTNAVPALVRFSDASAGSTVYGFVTGGTTTVTLGVAATSGAFLSFNNVSSTVPFTWAITDNFATTFTYLAAA